MTEYLTLFGAYDFAVRDALMLSLVALSIYVLLSAGIFAVPQVGFMAVGAYVSAILSVDAELPFVLSLVGGAAAGAAIAFLLALLLARLNGIYLAIASIAFSEIVRVAVLNVPLTGGSQGKVGIPRDADDVWITAVVLLGFLGLALLKRSRHGLAIAAMREDALMARHQGVDVVRYRMALFTVSGLLAGTGGAVYVHMSGFVEPGQFDFELLTQLLAVVVLGGMTYVSGSLVGAAVVFGLPVALSGLAEYQVLVNGILIVLVVAFAPGGILGLAARVLRRGKHGGAGDLAPPVRGTTAVLPLPESRETVLDVADVSMLFGGVAALDGVSVQARAGEVLGVIGPNGSGKTTLLNVLSGVYVPTTGSGTFLGRELRTQWGKPHRLADAGIARTFQTIRLMDEESALVNVALGVPGAHAGQRHEVARDLLRDHGLDGVADTPVGELPYGARRRVEIARALARKPRLLLLDEPTAGMNPEERQDVFDTVSTVRASGVAVIVVEHDVAMMRAFCDRLMVLDFGKVLAEGDPEKVLESEEVIRAYIGSGALA